jgi:hypothetical protein
LTLRTLLAYLDDTLEPAQAKEVGQKIADNELAQKLIERIKTVLRDPRLTTPPSTGPNVKLDVHTIAEYLDNVLPAEKAAEVEELCLGNEAYLAEIAACHQILTQTLGESALVPPPARQRMYGLIKGRGIPRRRSRAVETPPAEAPRPEHDEDDEALLLGLPPLLRQGGWLRWLAPLAGVIGLCVLLGLVIWQALPQTAPTEHARAEVPAAVPLPEDRPAEPKIAPPEAKTPALPPPVEPVKPPLEKPPQPEELPKPIPKPVPKQVIDRVPEKLPSAERKVVGQYVATGRSILLRRTAADAWQRLTPPAPVTSTELLVSLPGYHSELMIDGVRLTLWGSLPQFNAAPQFAPELPVVESAIVLHVPDADRDVDFTLDRGRVVLANLRQGAARVRLRFPNEIWDLTLESQAQLSVELWSRYPRDVPFSPVPGGEGPMYMLYLLVLKGEAAVRFDFRTTALQAPARLSWTNIGPGVEGPQPLAEPPRWFAKPLPQVAQVQQMIAALDELNLALNRKGANLDLVLAETRESPRPATRMLGILCLGAIDAISGLVDALEDERPDVREEAINTLRHWSGLRPDNDRILFQLLQDKKNYSRVHATIFMQLLHGFSENDSARPETYDTLLAYLKHDKIAIRELAWYHLSRLVPEQARRMPFDAAADKEQRDRQYDLWRQFIPEGKLPPKPMVPPKKTQ